MPSPDRLTGSPESPHGYRLIQHGDLAVGKDVMYISRDPETPPIHTRLMDTKIYKEMLHLKHKGEAPMKRCFVAEEKAADGIDGPAAKRSRPATVGATATVSTEAAVGATGATATVSAGAAQADTQADLKAEQAVRRQQQAQRIADHQAALAETEKFLKTDVVRWISSWEAGGSSLAEALEAQLARLEKTPEDMVKAFKEKVPWVPCVNFQTVPKYSKKGTLHISMLSYLPCSYSANGMFVSDAKLILSEGFGGLQEKILPVKPRAGASMTCFGWEADGSVANSTYAFAMSCIVAYCVCNDCSMPQPLAQLLQSIPVRFTKHDNTQSRLLQSLVDSAVQRHANRTVQCPIFLAEELNRCTFQTQYVKSFVKLYQQRMSLKPALQLPPRMEDCVIRIMTQTKTCAKAMKSLTQAVVKFTWDDGPWVVGHIMSPFFPIGSNLNSSTHEEWAKLNVQTALGQTLALEIGNAIFEASNRTLDCEDE